MNHCLLILLTGICPLMLSAATLRVGPGEIHTQIQAAIDAAAPGDTIVVSPGMYQENLVLSKSPLVLEGAQAANDARGRVDGAPDPLIESVVAPVTGKALELASGDGAITVSGFSFVAVVEPGTGVISVVTADPDHLLLTNNHVRAAVGSTGAALRLDRNAVDASLSGNVFMAAPGSLECIALAGEHSYRGLSLVNNHVVRDGVAAHVGLRIDGNRNIGSSLVRSPVIRGNLFQGHGVGFHGGARSLQGVEISDNTFKNNLGGLAAGPRDCLMSGNLFVDNSDYGLRLTAFGASADAESGASGNVIENNGFSGNGASATPGGHGDICCDTQATGMQATNLIRRNRIESPVAIYNNDAGAVLAAAYNFWGAEDGPGGSAPGGGGDLNGAGNVSFEPFFADVALRRLVYGSATLEGEVVLEDGQTIAGELLELAPAAILRVHEGARLEVGELLLPAGSSLSVRRGAAAVSKLGMRPGAVIDVVDGDLAFDPAGDGQYHTIGGSFTFFNCLGSLQINGNTTFSGDTLGLASDIHVLSGSSMLVMGSLALDNCRIDSTGSYSVMVNIGASLSMTRCEVKGAAISLLGSQVTLSDNQFSASTVTVFSMVNGAKIHHNIFSGGLGLLNILPGAVVTTAVEGWGNVANPALVKNELALAFRAPDDPTRTLDSSGNLYVQPGDPVAVGLDIGKLNVKTQAVETLLGFSTDYLTVSDLRPSDVWSNGLYQMSDETAMIGKVNTAVGLGFTNPDPDGTTTAGQVADILMTAGTQEGLTRVFFRTKTEADHSLINTRLTASSGGAPYFKESPFTRNTAVLTVDGTAPVFSSAATAAQMQSGMPVDVLAGGAFTRRGTVSVSFDVADELAGIEPADVQAELVGVGGILVGTPAGSVSWVDGDLTYTRWTYTFTIVDATPDGLYEVKAEVMDRSGNSGSLDIGVLDVSKSRIHAQVEPQGLVSTSLIRDVVFTATDTIGSVLATWTEPVNFNGGTGALVLEQVPEGTAFLSAKMGWNLRVRLPVSFDSNGRSDVAFVAEHMLPGGDFTGNNVVNVGDYNILRALFPGVANAPDITGDGFVNVGDYNILRANWLTIGDPE